MKKRTFLRRMVMVLLLFGAIYTTISTISNVTMNDIFMNKQHVMVDSADDKIMQENEQKMLSTILKNELPEKIDQEQNEKSLEAIEQAIKEKFPKEHVIATGYTAGPESTGKNKDHPEYGITYSGIEATRSLYSTIAADLTVYPLGTIMYIPQYGYGVVADKGSAITGNKIDLYYQTVDDVYHEWGKKELDVYIVKMGDGSVTAGEMEQLNENATLEVFGEE